EIVADLDGLRMSYWALFGWFSILAPASYYAYFDALLGLGAIGLVVVARRVLAPKDRPPVDGLRFALVALAALAALGAVFAYRLLVLAFQGRLLFAGIGAFSVLLGLGWSSLAPARVGKRVRQWAPLAVAGSLAIPAALAPWTVLRPAYAAPPVVEPAQVSPRLPLDVRFGDEVRVLGAAVTPVVGSRIQPGQAIELTLYLQGLRPMGQNYMLSLRFEDLTGRPLTAIDTYPGRGALPTSFWEPGKVVVDHYRVRVPASGPAPLGGRITVNVYRRRPPAGPPAALHAPR